MEWDAADHAMRAVVRGSSGTRYQTALYFEPTGDAQLEFAFGEPRSAALTVSVAGSYGYHGRVGGRLRGARIVGWGRPS
jgi:hypothetical protein